MHRRRRCRRTTGHHARAVSGRQGQPDSRFHALAGRRCQTGCPPGTRALKLVPKTPQPDYDWLILVVDPATLALRGLVTVDAQGGTSSFSFTNLKENVGLADKEFIFNIRRAVLMLSPMPSRALSAAIAARPRRSSAAPGRRLRRVGGAAAAGRDAERRQDYDRAVVEYTKALRSSPTTPTRGSALDRAKLRASDGALSARPPPRRDRQVTMQALVEYELAAELNPTSSEVDNALRDDAQPAAREDRRRARRQDRAADAHRARARSAAAGPRPPGRRQDAGVARLPRREQPRRLPGDRAVRRHQPRRSIRRSARRRSPSTCGTRRSTTR